MRNALNIRCISLLLLSLIAAPTLAQRDSAAQAVADTWVRNVPRDAAFYWSLMRTGEQVQALLKSKALARVVQLFGDDVPDIDLADFDLVEVLQSINDEDAEEFQEWLEDEQNQELIRLATELLSHEVFMYGGQGWSEFMRVYTEFNSRMYREMARATREGDDEPEFEDLMPLDQLEKLTVPQTVIGFRVKNRQRATEQLARLRQLLPLLLAEQPELAEFIEEEQIHGETFLTFSARGSQIPWEEMELDEDDEEIVEKIRPALAEKTINVSLGLVGDYVLLSVGESNEHLKQLKPEGTEQSLLTHPKLARFRQYADQRLTSLTFVSDELADSSYGVDRYLSDIALVFGSALHDVDSPLDDMTRARIERDLQELAEDIGQLVPQPAAMLTFSFLTPEGFETFTESWAENLYLDGTQPLPLMDHIGGDPLLASVGRAKYHPDQGQKLVKWAKKLDRYFQQFGAEALDDDDREDYEEIRAALLPVLSQLKESMSAKVRPALRDGQRGFVIDAKLTNKQWHVLMPPSDEPLALLELACLFGVSDADKLKEGVAEIWAALNQGIAALHEARPDDVPEFAIPPAQKQETDVGELFSYPFLAALGGDPRIAPTAGVSDNVAVLTISQDHAERLLTKTPSSLGGIWAEHTGKPLAGATYFNWSGLIGAVVPWIEYGVTQKMAFDDDPDTDPLETIDIIRTVADFLKCFRYYSSVTFIDQNSIVSHAQCEVRDVE